MSAGNPDTVQHEDIVYREGFLEHVGREVRERGWLAVYSHDSQAKQQCEPYPRRTSDPGSTNSELALPTPRS